MTAAVAGGQLVPPGRVPGRWLLFAILLLAAGLRFWSALGTEVKEPFRGDAVDYVSYAVNLDRYGVYSRDPAWRDPAGAGRAGADEAGADKAGADQAGSHQTGSPAGPVPDAVRPPGYPALLALLLDGKPDAAFVRRVALLQAALGVLVVWLGFIAARMAMGTIGALAVAALLAISPHLIAHEALLLSETLYAFCFALVMVTGAALVRAAAAGRSTAAWGATLGLAFAASALVRPTLEHLPWLLALVALAVPASRRHWRGVLSMMMAFASVVGLWKIRSYLATGATGDPLLALGSFVHGSYPDFLYEGRADTWGYAYAFDPLIGSALQDAASALAYVGEKFQRAPGQMTWWYLVGKPIALFSWPMIGGWREVFTFPLVASPMLDSAVFKTLSVLMRTLHWPLVALGALAALLALCGGKDSLLTPSQLAVLRWCAIVMAFVVAVHIVAAPYSRYSVPFRPLLYLLSIYGAVRLGKFLVRQ